MKRSQALSLPIPKRLEVTPTYFQMGIKFSLDTRASDSYCFRPSELSRFRRWNVRVSLIREKGSSLLRTSDRTTTSGRR